MRPNYSLLALSGLGVRYRVLKVLKSAPYTVMEVEVGIPDNKPFEGEPSKWGAEEGTKLEDLELEVRVLHVVVEYACILKERGLVRGWWWLLWHVVG